MSFGWSAGDIAQAITFIAKVVKALDSAEGASRDYREAVTFLNRLNYTLEPLQAFSALDLNIAYGDEIKNCVESIREPIEAFLEFIRDLESALGSTAKQGRHRGIGKKLRWRFDISKKADDLRRRIEGDMMILSSIQTRLILELSMAMPAKFSGAIHDSFTNVLLPRVNTILQENIQPLLSKMGDDMEARQVGHSSVLSTLETHRTSLQDLNTQTSRGQRDCEEFIAAKVGELNQSIGAAAENAVQQVLAAVKILESEVVMGAAAARALRQNVAPAGEPVPLFIGYGNLAKRKSESESLRDLYRAVFFCLGYLLRDIFLAFSRMLRPMPALTPQLPAKYNISFYDALGRPPRILAYENFIFEAFLQHAFADRPGESWVQLGLYKLANARNGQTITPQSWAQVVMPGSHVNMSILVHQIEASKDACPDTDCHGSLVATGDCREWFAAS
ncbi:hypothetical protein DL98DRAFT_610122 [Cadophora sp. DSE1049]|nr:hypothetical protein DL98DRAFT_610122 [Cadophora sp. DSE1049]